MRIIKLYFRIFWIPVLLLVAAVGCWIFVPSTIDVFDAGVLGTAFGVGISIFAAEGMKKVSEHKRVKRTFVFLKLITIPYLKNQAENISATLNKYRDLCSIEQTVDFLTLGAHFDAIATNFDKSWLQLVYSQDFVDAIESDDHFNKLANAILEVLLFIKQATGQSINAKTLLMMNNISNLNDIQKQEMMTRAKKIRDDLLDNVQKLEKYIGKLDEEIIAFLIKNGATYSEFER